MLVSIRFDQFSHCISFVVLMFQLVINVQTLPKKITYDFPIRLLNYVTSHWIANIIIMSLINLISWQQRLKQTKNIKFYRDRNQKKHFQRTKIKMTLLLDTKIIFKPIYLNILIYLYKKKPHLLHTQPTKISGPTLQIHQARWDLFLISVAGIVPDNTVKLEYMIYCLLKSLKPSNCSSLNFEIIVDMLYCPVFATNLYMQWHPRCAPKNWK